MITTLDTLLSQQTFITGAIRDALNGRFLPTPPTIQLLDQTTSKPFPLPLHQDTAGNFAFYGDPCFALPTLSGGETLDLELHITTETHQPHIEAIQLNNTHLTPTTTTLTINGHPSDVREYPELPLHFAIVLNPLPVHLGGRVVGADDPTSPVANATVEVTAPSVVGPTTTDHQGFFTLQNMPVVNSVTVLVSHPSFAPLDTEVRLDYRQPLNLQTFALAP